MNNNEQGMKTMQQQKNENETIPVFDSNAK